MKDVRGDDSYLHEIRESLDGTRFLQNGPWDRDLLCSIHEGGTQEADGYGIEFCRSVVAEIRQDDASRLIENAKPRVLAKFAYQVVWRFCASHFGRGASALGPYGKMLESSLFASQWVELPILISRNHLRMPNGAESTLVIAPFPTRIGHWRFWLFAVGGVHFFIKFDKRPLPDNIGHCLAGQADPLTLFRLSDMDVTRVPILQPLMQRMVAR
nr:hypothetical protein [Polymorphobacter sp.]